jgi:hypothetical protein
MCGGVKSSRRWDSDRAWIPGKASDPAPQQGTQWTGAEDTGGLVDLVAGKGIRSLLLASGFSDESRESRLPRF